MKLLEKTNIGGIDLKNRMVRSATATFMADEKGRITPDVRDVYKKLAQGDVGLIIFEDTGVANNTLESKHLLINNDSYIPSYKELVDDVHSFGSKTIIQLSHSGIIEKDGEFVDVTNGFSDDLISNEDIKEIVKLYANAALRSQKAGFDGVQIHAAHGYFLTKFLSPFYNKRTDEYGGSVENRTKLVVEILNEIKDKCGNDYPVFLKLNSSDFMKEENTNGLEQGRQIAIILDRAGIDAIEVSGGVADGEYSCVRTKILKPENEAYHLENCLEISKSVSAPLILVGGMRSPDIINQVLEAFPAIQGVSLSRPFISEPNLIKRWKDGDHKKARCVSCNMCFNPEGATCILNRKKTKS